MNHYNNLVEAINDLRPRGFTTDFNVKSDCIECPSSQLRLYPAEFKINEIHRFEGDSTPDDSSILYVISSERGVKGILIDAYGTYAEALNFEMAQKLSLSKT